MVSIEERLKLMEEIGMTSSAEKIKADLAVKEEIKRLTDMKFKPTDTDKIREQICNKRHFEIDSINETMTGCFVFGGVGCVISCVALLLCILAEANIANCFWGLGASLLLIGLGCLCGLKKPGLDVTLLQHWRDNIPTGALLAVKEAKDKGLSHFEIYYPITQRRARIKADPVIVGYFNPKEVPCLGCQSCWGMPKEVGQHNVIKKGQMIEVFAWDDGKVYE